MNYTLIVSSNPRERANALALDFANAALAQGDALRCVFFIDHGASTALCTRSDAQDERDMTAQWAAIAAHCELCVCSASAQKFGVISDVDTARNNTDIPQTLHPAFTIGGLGVLIEATDNSDRVLNF